MRYDNYEPDFFENEIFDQEPIYSYQLLKLLKLTSLPRQHLLQLTSKEADSFINVLQQSKIINSYEWLNRKKAEKRQAILQSRMAQESLPHQVSSLSVSATITESPDGTTQVRISKIRAKILLR